MPSVRDETPPKSLVEGGQPEVLPSTGRPHVTERFPASFRNALYGIAMGLGAPAGALLLRMVLHGGSIEWEIRDNAFFYVYTLIGTCLVFGAFGFFTGRKAERLRRSRDEYEVLADHDELTRLLNARAFERHCRRQLEETRRTGEPLSLLLVDVDRLKLVNDRWGHVAGSAALVEVARGLERQKRVGDLACRWGGDEFAVVMPRADADAASRVARGLLDSLQGGPDRGADRPAVTVTIGIASAPPSTTPEELFERADRALYEGKREGGACYKVAVP
jgi:diguanylate cyclase (GGDEF)-like protein